MSRIDLHSLSRYSRFLFAVVHEKALPLVMDAEKLTYLKEHTTQIVQLPGLESCATSGNGLIEMIDMALTSEQKTGHLDYLSAVRVAAAQFEHVWMDRLERLPAYVPKIGGVVKDAQLISAAHEGLEADVQPLLTPDVKRNLDEAGRALAFNLPTASTFHASRALERVASDFCLSTAQTSPHYPAVAKHRHLGRYCSILSQKILGHDYPWPAHSFDDDPRKLLAASVIGNLWFVKNDHRDLLTHEASEWYEEGDAAQYMGMVGRCVTALLREQRDRKWSDQVPA